MDIAIVTGAETPLGLSLIQRLVRQGYRVHGIGNNFSKVTFADPQFFAHPVDLTDLPGVTETLDKILEKENSLDLLIHAIDVTPGAAFEKLPVGNLEAILKIGLLGPVMLTRLSLPNLLRFRGQLINVIPANKSGAPASAVNALLEGGLREMNRALFDSARDAGLRVTNLILRQNPEPDALSVQSSEQTHIDLEDVARVVEHLLDPSFTNVPSEVVLHPRSSAYSDRVLPEVAVPLDPYAEVVLPPTAYCPPEQSKIPTQEKATVDRTIPYTDDEMEDKIAAAIEDFESNPQIHERKEKKSLQQNKQEGSEPGGKNKRRRGRRRGGRSRNRDRKSDQADGAPSQGSQNGDSKSEQSIPKSAGMGSKPKRKASSKKEPTKKATKKLTKKTATKPSAGSSSKKTAKKVAAKKVAKKSAKKTAAKKATKKKAAKAK
ncbi:MAG: SDR family NAD(P)-dependent oxidoreductase [Puniceicoccaceae bacterium]|nr:MAG: SDR family NAD(P)-dependent oxidoreductase [Puniceicoccaceae bacterium]